MVRQTIHKAVVSALGGLITLSGVIFGVDFAAEYGIGETEIVAIGTVVTTFLVYWVPNQTKE